jgi:peptide chain release factor 1
MFDTESIRKEYNELLSELSNPELISNWEKMEELSKKKNYLEKIIEKEKEIQAIENQIQENKTILRNQEEVELFSLAENENAQLEERKKTLKEEFKKLLENQEIEEEPNSVIIEIRAGAGGNEASLFVNDLFKMYSKYSITQNWKEKILDSHPTELNGLKQIIFQLKGVNVFSKMKLEAGVHRVQRIPETEKSGRIHTSTVSVAVLAAPKKTQVKISPNDLKIDVYKSSGPGGQNVNKRMTAIRITHIPTGIIVASQNERNQLQNRENALSILAARLLEKYEQTKEEKLKGKRKTQIGEAKRAEKIRTYNFPQDRITDHRIKKSWSNIQEIMEGKLDKIIEDLQAELA